MKAEIGQSKNRKLLWIILGAVFLPTLAVVLLLLAKSDGNASATAKVHAQYTPRDVIGDLGGMKVTIPSYVAELVEYDGDPGWSAKRDEPRPTRTHSSKLNSFGYEVRYPDMATLSSPELRADFEKRQMYQHPWVTISVQSGSRYPGHGFLNRRYNATIPNPDQQSIYRQYESLPSPVKGLELFAKRGVNPNTGIGHRYEGADGDIFVGRNHRGEITTFISCLYLSAAPRYFTCEQDWSMEEHSLGIKMRARYVPSLLPQWQDIQGRVSTMVLNFKTTVVSEAPTSTP